MLGRVCVGSLQLLVPQLAVAQHQRRLVSQVVLLLRLDELGVHEEARLLEEGVLRQNLGTPTLLVLRGQVGEFVLARVIILLQIILGREGAGEVAEASFRVVAVAGLAGVLHEGGELGLQLHVVAAVLTEVDQQKRDVVLAVEVRARLAGDQFADARETEALASVALDELCQLLFTIEHEKAVSAQDQEVVIFRDFEGLGLRLWDQVLLVLHVANRSTNGQVAIDARDVVLGADEAIIFYYPTELVRTSRGLLSCELAARAIGLEEEADRVSDVRNRGFSVVDEREKQS